MTEVERLREALEELLVAHVQRALISDGDSWDCERELAVIEARAALAATPPGAERGAHDFARKIILRRREPAR